MKWGKRAFVASSKAQYSSSCRKGERIEKPTPNPSKGGENEVGAIFLRKGF